MPHNYPILVSPPTAQRSTATLMKTGQTTSYRTGDDGDLERGRGVDFFTLAENNIFGNTYRFTGVTGGYYDGSNWKNAAGVTVLESVAIPENIVIDNSTYSEKTSTVLGFYRDITTTHISWDAAVDWCAALATTSYNNKWAICNKNELDGIVNMLLTSGSALNYPPFNIAGIIAIWTGTTVPTVTTSAYYLNTQLRHNTPLAKSTAVIRAMAVRVFTVTGTTLT